MKAYPFNGRSRDVRGSGVGRVLCARRNLRVSVELLGGLGTVTGVSLIDVAV